MPQIKRFFVRYLPKKVFFIWGIKVRNGVVTLELKLQLDFKAKNITPYPVLEYQVVVSNIPSLFSIKPIYHSNLISLWFLVCSDMKKWWNWPTLKATILTSIQSVSLLGVCIDISWFYSLYLWRTVHHNNIFQGMLENRGACS